MAGFKPVYRKELYSFFASPTFYVVALIFLIIAGYFFFSAVSYYNILSFQGMQNPMWREQLNPTEMVLRPFFMDISVIMLLVCPLLTMRVLAEERKTNTSELLFTYPLSDTGVLVGKFLATLSVLFIIILGTLPSLIYFGTLTPLRWQIVGAGYLGLFLLAAAFISLGILASSLTENQIIAAVIAFGALLLFWVIGWSKAFTGPQMARFINYISIINHFENFAKGVIDIRDVVYYVVFSTFFLFLTLRFLESQRWRG